MKIVTLFQEVKYFYLFFRGVFLLSWSKTLSKTLSKTYCKKFRVQDRRNLCNIINRIYARFSQEINLQYLSHGYPTFLHAARRKVDRVWRQESHRFDSRQSHERYFASALPAHHEWKIHQCRNYTILGEPTKTLDTDLRMSIVLSRDVLTGGWLLTSKLHVY